MHHAEHTLTNLQALGGWQLQGCWPDSQTLQSSQPHLSHAPPNHSHDNQHLNNSYGTSILATQKHLPHPYVRQEGVNDDWNVFCSSVLVASSMWHMACQNQHSPCMCACRYIHMSHAVTTNTHTQTNVHTPIASGVAPPKHVTS